MSRFERFLTVIKSFFPFKTLPRYLPTHFAFTWFPSYSSNSSDKNANIFEELDIWEHFFLPLFLLLDD